MLKLAANSVHLWCLDLDHEPHAIGSLDQTHVDWLSDHERRRFRRLQLARRRQRYLLGKVFTRQVLSRYSATEPQAWQFAENAHGKPFIVGVEVDAQAPALHFNLSHSRQRFVLAVSRVPATGVDVEFCVRKRRVSRLAQRYFTAAESAWLLGLPASEQQQAFYQLWTLKEAYMKARGKGQALPLHGFAFDLSRPGLIGLQPDDNALPESRVVPGGWHCWRLADPMVDANCASRYAMSLVLGLDSSPEVGKVTGVGASSAITLSAYRYSANGDDQQLALLIHAASAGSET
ncbi:MAG: hypothetical protein PsegKO_19810 [Pseudohongiellaceae bacterium]